MARVQARHRHPGCGSAAGTRGGEEADLATRSGTVGGGGQESGVGIRRSHRSHRVALGAVGEAAVGESKRILVNKLLKKFGRHEAVRDLSFSVPEGSAFALIGANGAGKSTTIQVLMNILEPTHGTAEVLGVDSRNISPRELGQIGYVSENQDMPEKLTVEEFLAYLRPFYPTWDTALEKSILSELRLPLERKIGDLSHGMRMKMSLACALPFRPKLLVLDEPFSGLDPLVRDCARWSAMSEPLMPNRWRCAPFLQLWRARREKEHFHEANYEHDLAYLQKRFEITMAVCSGRSRNSSHVGGPVLCDGPHSCERSAAKYIQPAAIRCAPGKRSSHCYGGAPGRNPWRPARLAGASPEPTRSIAGQGALCLVAGAWTNFAHRHDGRIAERISRRPRPDSRGIAQPLFADWSQFACTGIRVTDSKHG